MYKLITISLISILFLGQPLRGVNQLTLDSPQKESGGDKPFSNPFIDELYAKGVAKINGDSIDVEIPFDSHANDCGAPDCYRTMVSFQLPYKIPLILPEELKISYYDTGCYNEGNEKAQPLNFVMLNKGSDIVVYYNRYQKVSLVLFTRDNPKEGFSLAFFLVNINADQLTPSKIYNLRHDYREEEDDSVYPYTCTILRDYGE